MNDSIKAQLELKKWYSETSPEVKAMLEALPDGYSGFLEYLGNFPDQMGDLSVLALQRIAKCNFSLICPIFEVCKKGGKPFTYEFASWKMGRDCGSKGIVFLVDATSSRTTHFVMRKGFKFALGAEVLDCVGGFKEDNEEAKETFARELSEEIGVKVEKVRLVDLGEVCPDAGLTNGHVRLFAAYATVDCVPAVHHNDDWRELQGKTVVFPIEAMTGVVAENKDGFFLSIVARLLGRDYLSL